MIFSFNRTFMELKYPNMHQKNHPHIVLIVPLWNWNFPCALLISLIWSGFNRTFMELKYLLFDDVQNPRNTF